MGRLHTQQTMRDDFIRLVNEKGKVWAQLSHSQEHPDRISRWAILEWEIFNGRLSSVTVTGKRVFASSRMPAYFLYDMTEDEKARVRRKRQEYSRLR